MARKVYLGPRLDLTPDQAALLVTLRLWCATEKYAPKWGLIRRVFLGAVESWLWSLLNMNTAGGYIEPHGDRPPDARLLDDTHPEGETWPKR